MIGDDVFGVLKVFDYKHGAGVPVEVESNPQLLYYALGAVKDSGYDMVELVIVQPRAIHPDGPVRRWTISVKDLMEWAEKVLLPGAKVTELHDAPLNAGEHCRFCPALPTCPAQKALALSVAKTVFDDKPKAPPAPEALTTTELRKVLDVSDLIEAWLKACREHVRNLLEEGTVESMEVGYKLVPGRMSRSWTDEEKAREWLEAMLDDEAYTKPALISPAQAEKKLTGAVAKKAIKEMVCETVGGFQLVPLSDKREEIKPAILAFREFKED